MKTYWRLTSFLLCIFVAGPVMAELQLYPTGPKDILSYVRFVNATDSAISVVSSSSSAKVELGTGTEARASAFFPVKVGEKQSVTIKSGNRKITADVVGKPWEYIVIAVLPKGANQIGTGVIKEGMGESNATKASLALFNLDAQCAGATLQDGLKRATKFADIKPLSVQRYLVSPVKLTAGVVCGGQPESVLADIPQLQAGERYSVFLMALKNSRQAIFIRDGN